VEIHDNFVFKKNAIPAPGEPESGRGKKFRRILEQTCSRRKGARRHYGISTSAPHPAPKIPIAGQRQGC
jgi:hypothetical protein